jgi:hypothetical protein
MKVYAVQRHQQNAQKRIPVVENSVQGAEIFGAFYGDIWAKTQQLI